MITDQEKISKKKNMTCKLRQRLRNMYLAQKGVGKMHSSW